jgi:hypothetical protein
MKMKNTNIITINLPYLLLPNAECHFAECHSSEFRSAKCYCATEEHSGVNFLKLPFFAIDALAIKLECLPSLSILCC